MFGCLQSEETKVDRDYKGIKIDRISEIKSDSKSKSNRGHHLDEDHLGLNRSMLSMSSINDRSENQYTMQSRARLASTSPSWLT